MVDYNLVEELRDNRAKLMLLEVQEKCKGKDLDLEGEQGEQGEHIQD